MMAQSRPAQRRELLLAVRLFILVHSLLHAAAVKSSHAGGSKEAVPVAPQPGSAEEAGAADAVLRVPVAAPVPPSSVVASFIRENELREAELEKARERSKYEEDLSVNSHVRGEMVAASGSVLQAATNLRGRIEVSSKKPWYWDDFIVPTFAFLTVVVVMLTFLFLIASSIPSPSHLLRGEPKRGCCGTFCHVMFGLHWRTHLTLLIITLVGWSIWIVMWWANIIQPWIEQLGMIVFALLLVVSLMMLLIMELTEKCKEHGRKAMEKVEKIETYFAEKVEKVKKKAGKVLDILDLDDSSEDEAEVGGSAGGTPGATAASLEEEEEPKRPKSRRQPACC